MRLAVLALALVISACAQPPKAPKYGERVVLLPNRDGRPSAVIVKRAGGEQQIANAYEGVELVGGIERRTAASADHVENRYGELLKLQPPRAMSITLYFNTRSTELAPRSKADLAEVREKIKAFPAGEVVVIGHADRVGTTEANDALSLKRAAAIRDMLVQLGMAREIIEVVGRGEREPLIHTADGVSEERNRRVEIKLR